MPDNGARTRTRTVAAGTWIRATNATGGIDYALSPDGGDLLLSARGDLFGVRLNGSADNLTATTGIDEDHPSWSPNGRTIAYETDAGGEQQLALRSARGGSPYLLTHFATGYRYEATWSPSGNLIAVPDANHALWLVLTNGSGARLVTRDLAAEIRDAGFSPDGRWLAYSATRPNQLRAIHLYELSTGRDTELGTPMESDRDPVFSSDGRLLLFVSQRHELPFVSDRDDESIIATLNSDGLYAATLDPSDPSPLLPAPVADRGPRPLHVGLDGLLARAVALPVTPTVINGLAVRGGTAFYQTSPPQILSGDLPGQHSALHALDLRTLADRVVLTKLSGSSLSADGSRVAFRSDDGAWHIASTRPGPGTDTTLDLSGMRATVDPRAEWRQMFEQAWRLDRDVFFSATMNGNDWRAVHDAYAPLLPLLGSDDDFLYMLSQLQGELASSHTFIVSPGDHPVPTPRLGADYALDPKSGRIRLAHIYAGDNTRAGLHGPLSQPGLGLHEGDILLAINGRPLQATESADALLAGQRGPAVLTVAGTSDSPSRTVTVEPTEDEMSLRLVDMIARNRERVDWLSGGRLGYVFLSNFEALGSRQFVRQFYPQAGKDRLVIDERWNEGGFTSQAVLDVLRRIRAGVFVNREGAVTPLPTTTAPPVLVTLINEGSASDGDQFPYFFRRFGLGPVVGTRSWGGVQGINAPWPLMNGTGITIPKDSLADLDRHWIIENEGTAPDITIDDKPDDVIPGVDTQLDGAVRVALDRLGHVPVIQPGAPAPLPAYPAAGNVPGASFLPGSVDDPLRY